MAKTVQLTVSDDAIATINFARPDAMNAFNQQMGEELEAVTSQVKRDASIRAVCLRGAGSVFMAGGDIQFFQSRLDKMPEGVPYIIRQLTASIQNLREMPKPVLACVHGAVAGAGISLMLACDLVISAESCQFTLAYSAIGTSPDGGLTAMLSQTVGLKRAMALVLRSERFAAAEAKNIGLINDVVADEALDEVNQQWLHQLAAGPTLAYAKSKQLINHSFDKTFAEQAHAEALAFTECTTSADFKMGVNAFLAKQKPTYKGV